MTASRFDIRPLTPTLGACIEGLDLQACPDASLQAFEAALLQWKVVVLRAPGLTPDALLGITRRLGTPMRLPYIRPLRDSPEVIAVLKEADEVNMGVFGGEWHSDVSFLSAPPRYSLLHACEIPPVGGDTLWANMVAAYSRLEDALKKRLKGIDSIHTGAPYGVKHAPDPDDQFTGSIEMARNNPEADRETRHPAVCRIPETGDSALFVNPTYTIRLEGMSANESSALLERLYRHCTRPEFTCRLRWQAGDLVVWDNRQTLHYAVNDYDGFRRLLHRCTVAGSEPQSAAC